MKIIVIEDEVRIREGITRLLGKINPEYEVVGEAENGCEGLELIRRCRPDVVITDIKMANMDGLEMLTAMYEEGIGAKAVVLSAYSEFEYARKAMRMGVTEYLLKPVTFGDLSQAMTHMRRQLEKERQQPKGMESLEQIFQGLLAGTLTADPDTLDYLQQQYEIGADAPVIQICVYLGSLYEKNAGKVRRELQLLMELRKDFSYCILHAAYEKSILVLVYRYQDYRGIEHWLQQQILTDARNTGNLGSIGWIVSAYVGRIREDFETLYPYMDWSISLGDDVVICYPRVTSVRTIPCTYPVEVENDLKIAMCANDRKKVENCVQKFHRFFRQGSVYNPREIKECYVRFLWALISISKEVGTLDYKSLNQQELLEEIMSAKKHAELVQASENLLKKINPAQKQGEDTNLTVKIAKSMIHEFYQRGITLEEIALKLDITPEYLSGQFHREVGMTFSHYIRNYRMNKAKELLIGTQLKLYEVADKVGYSDAKYFSRMFREYTGQLPAEYRKTHK